MGALKNQLKQDLVTAMKAKDDAAKSNIRMALTAIHNEEVAGDVARELSDAEETTVVTKEVNKRKDSAEAYRAGGREDLADKEASEAAFLAQYLPAPLTEDEVQTLVDEEVAAASVDGEKPTMRQMGQIIKAVSARAEGRSDGKTISGLVKKALA
ncbi:MULTISPECIES: GatB/YqeY domain-containing protein [unclassified Luteococcus]|uniref:GatB/YqeY domain-containing protein n=1 Tax=unclassified Luteococcus TaxID=2639923 RepID=UPI00313DC730